MGDTQNILVEKKMILLKEGNLPKEFYPDNLTNLFVDKFVTWDESYRKAIPGSDDGYVRTTYKYHIMKFPRNENGKLDVSNGTYSRKR